MATVSVTLARVRGDVNRPIPRSVPDETATTITTSGTSQQASITADDLGEVWVITTSGGNVWAAFGSDPTATAGTHWLLLAGTTREFSVSAVSEKVAVVNA